MNNNLKKKSSLRFPLEIQSSKYKIYNKIHIKHNYKEIITCKQASQAKNILLKNELKSLLLKTSIGFYVVHLSGSSTLNNRKVKQFLSCKEASLASKSELNRFGLSPGTVCAIINPIWELPHLFSNEIFNLNFVSTNNGTKSGYLVFNPNVLLLSKNHKIGDFTR